jgi:hypothetical protein
MTDTAKPRILSPRMTLSAVNARQYDLLRAGTTTTR